MQQSKVQLINIIKLQLKTTAQIQIHYQIDINFVTISKSSKYKYVNENFNVFDLSLTHNDIIKLDGLNKNQRIYDPIAAKKHEYYQS